MELDDAIQCVSLAAAPEAPCFKNLVRSCASGYCGCCVCHIWRQIENFTFKPEAVSTVAVVSATF